MAERSGSERHLNEAQFHRDRGRPRQTVHKVSLAEMAAHLPSHSRTKHSRTTKKLGNGNK